jgi:hypothetical protein
LGRSGGNLGRFFGHNFSTNTVWDYYVSFSSNVHSQMDNYGLSPNRPINFTSFTYNVEELNISVTDLIKLKIRLHVLITRVTR